MRKWKYNKKEIEFRGPQEENDTIINQWSVGTLDFLYNVKRTEKITEEDSIINPCFKCVAFLI